MSDDEHVSKTEQAAAQSSSSTNLFDLRVISAVLFAIYGVILTLMGLFGTDEEGLAKAGGININLWTGVALLVAAALFVLWARLSPLVSGRRDQPDSTPAAQPRSERSQGDA